MSAPLVTIVMAAYNGAALISETLDSLSRQTLTDFELLVVDDASTDDTRAVVAAHPDPRVRLIALDRNGGPVLARNHGVAEARGRYIAGLDHDDLCRPERLARQVAYMEAHPDTVLLGTQADYLCDGVVSPSAYPVVTTPGLIEWLVQIENPLVWSSTMFRAEAARTLAPFTRPQILYAEDFDLYHRMGRLGRLARLDEPLLIYRQHSGSASRRHTDTMRASAAQVLAETHADLFGDQAGALATLLSRHVMGGEPVPDRASLVTLGKGIARIQRHFLDWRLIDGESLRLIRWETAQRWARIGRAGLRAGTLSLADVLAARPDHIGLGYAGLDALLWSGAIGGLRRTRGVLAR